MADDRQLPDQRNPLIEEDRAPAYEILVERRCLGQTELKVRPGQVGTSSATMPDNLGMLDYAHLRVPLPKDLSNSGIFARGANKKYPEAYFLMRRSSDGFISATGMFKAAFPYAQAEDEAAEKDYMKTLTGTSSEEVAGNVWIHPDQAVALADEYGLRIWIEALLDPEEITHGTSDPAKTITSPPAYYIKTQQMNGNSASVSRSPKSEKKSSSSSSSRRSKRSVSPVKKSSSSTSTTTTTTTTSMTPARKIATPKSRRTTAAASGTGRTTRSSVEPPTLTGIESSLNGEIKETFSSLATTTTTSSKRVSENIKSAIDSLAEEAGESAEKVSADAQSFFAGARGWVDRATNSLLASPSSASASASNAVKNARASASSTAAKAEKSAEKTVEKAEKAAERVKAKGKRKADEMLEDVEEEETQLLNSAAALVGEGPEQHLSKRMRTEVETRRERLRRRAAVGVGATLAVGGLVPVISSLIPMALSAFGAS